MAIDIASAIKLFSGMGMDKSVIREIGAELAKGMKDGGNSSFYSSGAPSGGEAAVAGGRGPAQSEAKTTADRIKAEQLATEVTKKSIKGLFQLNKTLRDSGKRASTYVDDMGIYSRVFEKRWDDTMDKVGGSVRVQQNLIRNLNKAGYENISTMEDVIELREKQQNLERRIQAARVLGLKGMTQEIKEHRRLSEVLNVATQDIESSMDSFEDAIQTSIKGFFSWQAGLVNLTIAMKQMIGDVKAQLKFGSGMGLVENQMQAMFAGIDPGALSEMMAHSRQASFQFKDMATYGEALAVQQRKLFQSVGDTTEALKMASDMSFLLGRSGIRPTIDAMSGMTSSFHFLNKAVGLTSDQFTGIIEGLTLDESIQTKLRGARKEERQAILDGLAKRLEENVAIGMTIEQATEAARAMGKIAGGGAKERFKQAAKTQSMMAAMGIEGGERAAELIRKGQRISSDEQKELQSIMGQVSDAAQGLRTCRYRANRR